MLNEDVKLKKVLFRFACTNEKHVKNIVAIMVETLYAFVGTAMGT
jgi:hypothetical protein